jgi:predicted solute-binding protein
VALARIIWHEQFGRPLDILPYSAARSDPPPKAVLLIGDKVVNHKPIGFDIQTDLGLAWKSLTSLPFVFAVWAAPRDRVADADELSAALCRARDSGVVAAGLIAEDYGPGLGWPVALARRYLTTRLKFTLGPRQREGMTRFLALAKRYELISASKELSFT